MLEFDFSNRFFVWLIKCYWKSGRHDLSKTKKLSRKQKKKYKEISKMKWDCRISVDTLSTILTIMSRPHVIAGNYGRLRVREYSIPHPACPMPASAVVSPCTWYLYRSSIRLFVATIATHRPRRLFYARVLRDRRCPVYSWFNYCVLRSIFYYYYA